MKSIEDRRSEAWNEWLTILVEAEFKADWLAAEIESANRQQDEQLDLGLLN